MSPVNPQIFREYDIRGLADRELTDETVRAIGRAFAQRMRENGKSVIVTVNDRMAASNPAVIDVTHRAADDLGFAKAGKANVKLEVQK